MWEYNYLPGNELYHSVKQSAKQLQATARLEAELFNAFIFFKNEIDEMEERLKSVPPAGRSDLEREIKIKRDKFEKWQKKNGTERFNWVVR